MSFLDNLENDLKALESREEKDPEKARRDQEERESAKAHALRIAPYADALKRGQFTQDLLTASRQIGHGLRTLVRFSWLGQMLRLEAKGKKLELEPMPDGVAATYYVDDQEQRREIVDLNGDAHDFARRWLTGETQ